LKNNNNNNKELQRKKAKKNPAQPCYNTRRVIYILFIYFFFTPLCTPSEVDRVKNFVVFSTVRSKGSYPSLSPNHPPGPVRCLFLYNTRRTPAHAQVVYTVVVL